MSTTQWEKVIGLEVHIQLATQSKLFSGASTQFGAEPNTQACAIDLGLPGVLPLVNEAAIRMAVKFGLSIEADIAKKSVFARKNYFYPDLPKGYQITQYTYPIVENGHLTIQIPQSPAKKIAITRAHLEEDAGKLLHENFDGMSGVDLNRAGTPLLEIVTEPVLTSAEEAVAFLKQLRNLVRYLGICDGDMQNGSLRCDANISVRPLNTDKLGTRTEIKNLNSFRFIERAIQFEAQRQINLLENHKPILQETRLYAPDKNETRSMRLKEDEHNYRYFPDPDLMPVIIEPEWIEAIKKALPELPREKEQRFIQAYQLNAYTAHLLVSDHCLADFFEETTHLSGSKPEMVAHWITGELLAMLNKKNQDIENSPISPAQLAKLLKRIDDKTLSRTMAKTVFEAMGNGEGKGDPDQIIQARHLQQITDTSTIEAVINNVIQKNPKQLKDYQDGKEKLFGYFVGQVMKATQGKANPKIINELLRTKLNEERN